MADWNRWRIERVIGWWGGAGCGLSAPGGRLDLLRNVDLRLAGDADNGLCVTDVESCAYIEGLRWRLEAFSALTLLFVVQQCALN